MEAYLFVEFEGGGFLCSDHASAEDWASFAGLSIVRYEWRYRGESVEESEE